MSDLTDLRRRHIRLMQQTCDLLGHLLTQVDQDASTTLRDAQDGPKGWTVLEVVCHLRDYDAIFRARAQRILDEDYPTLLRSDHEALAVERAYNTQDLRQVYADLVQSRQATVAFFKGLDEIQWARAGVHPERGHFTLTDAVAQVGTHDVIHLEQITRILFENH